jgi:hypothetical protein
MKEGGKFSIPEKGKFSFPIDTLGALFAEQAPNRLKLRWLRLAGKP